MPAAPHSAGGIPASVAIRLPADAPAPVQWAAGELRQALARRGIAEVGGGDAAFTVRLATIAELRAAGVEPDETAEAIALAPVGEGLLAWGFDTRGQVYALTELADRVRYWDGEGPLFGPGLPLVEKPSARIRSIARLFCSDIEDKSWFHDRQFWHGYLSMLAANRFNRFALTLGMGYNYPYHNNYVSDVYFYFPYPFLLDLPGYGIDVAELSAEEREQNLETLKFIARETARRGLDFQLALWTQRYDFDDSPNANYTVRGVTDDNLAPYCRDAITALLKAVPEITGLTFRVHVEGGIPEGDYGFWETAFSGVAAAGRPVEIDMHGKGLDMKTIGLARASGMPVTASPKYMGEHMGLPYHQSAIREREYPPERARSEREQLSEGSRKFLRYSYGDLLQQPRDWKVLYRIWPGTQRVLLWGDPAFAAGYGRSSIFCGSEGVEWCEPGSFAGRMGTGVPGQRFGYKKQGLSTFFDWQKFAYLYRVWGRLLYNPDADRDSWMRYLRAETGDAAEAAEEALSLASRVLPLVSLAHAPSASNNHYWPEIYSNIPVGTVGTRNYGSDMDAGMRFGTAPSFDSQMFATPAEYAAALHAGRTERRYTPLDVADWLQELADGCEAALLALKSAESYDTPAVQRIAIDCGILAGMARFFAEKYRASTWTELFLLSKATVALATAERHLKRAVSAWEEVSAIAREVYPDDLTYGPQTYLRGSWQSRLEDIRIELVDLQSMRHEAPYRTREPDGATARAIEALAQRQPVAAGPGLVTAPASFSAGDPLTVHARLPAGTEAVLHYRHVNQAERWQQAAMQRDGEGFAATIGGDYTNSPFHLQFYVTAAEGGRVTIAPGLADDLANEPYLTSLRSGE